MYDLNQRYWKNYASRPYFIPIGMKERYWNTMPPDPTLSPWVYDLNERYWKRYASRPYLTPINTWFEREVLKTTMPPDPTLSQDFNRNHNIHLNQRMKICVPFRNCVFINHDGITYLWQASTQNVFLGPLDHMLQYNNHHQSLIINL